MAKKYIIDPKYLVKFPLSFTSIRRPGQQPKKVVLNATGSDHVSDKPATKEGPAQKVKVPFPTQEDLKILFAAGTPYVIESEEKAEKPKTDE